MRLVDSASPLPCPSKFHIPTRPQCKTVASEINGKTPEEIRTRFNIKNDFTPEEEEEIIRANVWCEER